MARMQLRIWAVAMAAALGFGQSVATRPEFAVASVKPNRSDDQRDYGVRGDRLWGRNMSLTGWIEIAYRVREFQLFGPTWMNEEKFDIEARSGGVVAATPAMLQPLLEDRFQLKYHRETREAPGYALVVGRGGVKMKASKNQTPWVGDFPSGTPDGRPTSGASPSVIARGRLAGKAVPMSLFVTLLADQVGRPIVNKTGLAGRYDFDFRFTPGEPEAAPQLSDEAPWVLTAVQEQLGLRLEPSNAPVEVLVIDHVERPSGN